jgi:glycine/D-amino acid oxidase-like deaminating enzyme
MYRDIIIVGAGVLGLSSALHLKKQHTDKNILLIDQFSGPGQGNTAKSAGIFLNLFTTEINYLLSDSTIKWFYHQQNDLGYNLNLTKYGYLQLLDDTNYEKLREPINRLKQLGVQINVYEKEELEKKIPELVTDFDNETKEILGLKPVKYGVLGLNCGSINPDSLARCLEKEFVKIGGETRYNIKVDELILKPEKELGTSDEPYVWQDIKIVGVKTNKGKIYADTTVIAAGVWSETMMNALGINCLMRPKTRNIYVFKSNRLERLLNVGGFTEYNFLPFTYLPMINAYLKVDPTEKSLWLGCADDFGRRYRLEDDPHPERDTYSNDLYLALIKYFPCFKDIRPINMWAGQRAINKFDDTPVVFPTSGMIYVGSASGYGVTKCDALGRIVSSIYSGSDICKLFDGRTVKTSDLGINARNVGKEGFHI